MENDAMFSRTFTTALSNFLWLFGLENGLLKFHNFSRLSMFSRIFTTAL